MALQERGLTRSEPRQQLRTGRCWVGVKVGVKVRVPDPHSNPNLPPSPLRPAAGSRAGEEPPGEEQGAGAGPAADVLLQPGAAAGDRGEEPTSWPQRTPQTLRSLLKWSFRSWDPPRPGAREPSRFTLNYRRVDEIKTGQRVQAEMITSSLTRPPGFWTFAE